MEQILRLSELNEQLTDQNILLKEGEIQVLKAKYLINQTKTEITALKETKNAK